MIKKNIFILFFLCIFFQSICSYANNSNSSNQTIKISRANFLLKQLNSNINYDVDLVKQDYLYRIPQPARNCEYKPGILTYISPDNENYLIPNGWSNMLDKYNLFFISPVRAGNNSASQKDRLGYALEGTLYVITKNNIDRNRIYASGFSGGSRTANALCFYQSDIYKGGVLCCGIDFSNKVPRVYATSDLDTNGYPYGNSLTVTNDEFNYVQNNQKFAIITGANDFRRGNILDLYYGGFKAYNFKAKLFDIANMGHEPCSGEVLDKALEFLTSNTIKNNLNNQNHSAQNNYIFYNKAAKNKFTKNN